MCSIHTWNATLQIGIQHYNYNLGSFSIEARSTNLKKWFLSIQKEHSLKNTFDESCDIAVEQIYKSNESMSRVQSYGVRLNEKVKNQKDGVSSSQNPCVLFGNLVISKAKCLWVSVHMRIPLVGEQIIV